MSVYQEIDAAESLPEVHAISVTLVDWFRDIATYDSLKTDCETIHNRQTTVMEQIRTGQSLPDTASDPDTTSGQNCAIRKRIVPTVSKKMLTALKAELDQLDVRFARTQTRMRNLAARIMTLEPASTIEATALMRFVIRILRSNDKVDRDYLADVLDTCTDTLGFKPQPARFKLQ